MKKLIFFLASCFFTLASSFAQDCFETKSLHFIKLEAKQIKPILAEASVKGENFCSYRDTLENSDTVRIAYKIKNNNYWVSFATPFKEANPAIELIDIDNDGTSELVIEGTTSKEIWPRGESRNGAIIIFQIENIPTQILNFCNSCNVSNLGGQYDEHPIDFSMKWELKISGGNIIIQKPLGKKLSKSDKRTSKKFCHLSPVKPGTYRLANGKFIKQ